MSEKSGRTIWEEFMKKFRDLVFIILFIITSIGWISTSVTDRTKVKVALEETTKVVNELKIEVREINRNLQRQAELNGQIMEYMRRQE
jgi:hypothetical protein